jgi:hypothetical protein
MMVVVTVLRLGKNVSSRVSISYPAFTPGIVVDPGSFRSLVQGIDRSLLFTSGIVQRL